MASHLDRIVYLNGEFIQGCDAKLSIFDRGLLFADAVYEGLGVLHGQLIDVDMHLKRLNRSLNELAIPNPLNDTGLLLVLNRLIAENEVHEGFVYLHITRGEADRDYSYSDELVPNVFAFTQPQGHQSASSIASGVRMISHEDLRWKRRDIKTSNLLGQVIAKQAATNAGAYGALLIDDEGFVTEGGATSFFIVKGNAILTRPVTNEILHGITRQAMLKVAEREGFNVTVQKFSLEEAYNADEAFITGASSYIEPVVEIDGNKIADGEPGPITVKLRAEYLRLVQM